MKIISEKFKNAIFCAVTALAATIVTVIVAFTLFACSRKVGISFTVAEINILAGETRDLYPYAVFDPATADDKSFTLVADDECVKVSGTKVIGVAAGTATVTASTQYGSCTISVGVSYRDIDGLNMTTSGDTVQNEENGEPTPVTFGVSRSEYSDPRLDIDWSVNGESVSSGDELVFTPSGFGEYAVSAAAGDCEATTCVKVFRRTVAYGECTNGEGGNESFKFVAVETRDSRNPQSVIEWKVDGKTASDQAVFEFSPVEPGIYDITLTVNGVARAISGKPTFTVAAAGKRAPRGEVVFDDEDGVFVTWDDNVSVRSLTITSPDGSRVNISRSDVRHESKFDRNRFNATEYISVCADDPGAYTVRLTGEARGDNVSFAQYDRAAEKYINNKLLINNAFISSVAQAAEAVDDAYATGLGSVELYLAYDVDGDDAMRVLADRAEVLGMTAQVSVEGSILSAKFGNYVSKPTTASVSKVNTVYSQMPHIEYDAAARRGSSYMLASDRIKSTVKVSGSEELLRAVTSGLKPVCETGSAAALIYSRARTELLYMIGADYTDEQKLHAIFDWTVWNIKISKSSYANSADKAEHYLESVFGGASVQASGVATSRGAAKVFALLSSMEGIDCEIANCVIDGEPYFWDRVLIDGRYYNVDVYGSKHDASKLGVANALELTSHSRFLISDARAVSLGLAAGDGEGDMFGKSYYLNKRMRDGIYFDSYIDVSEYEDSDMIKSLVFSSLENDKTGSFTVHGVGSTDTVNKAFYGLQIDCSALDATATQKTLERVRGYIGDYCETVLGKNKSGMAITNYNVDGIVHINIVFPIAGEAV